MEAAAPVVAVDYPTGLDPDTGIAGPHVFNAVETVTFSTLKTGHVSDDGPDLCGVVTVAAVGTRRLRSELVIGAEVSPTGIRLSGQYQTDRLTEQDITGVLDRIVEVLTAAGAS